MLEKGGRSILQVVDYCFSFNREGLSLFGSCWGWRKPGPTTTRALILGVDAMQIKPSARARQNHNEIAASCMTIGELVYPSINGEGDLMVKKMFMQKEMK